MEVDWSAIINFTVVYRGLWLFLVPICVTCFVGFITPRIVPSPKTWARKPVFREHIRKFYIVVVTKGSNEEAVREGYTGMEHLQHLHKSIELVVLTDEPFSYPDLNNVVCPTEFEPPNGKAKYKARALEYFRIKKKLTPYDWVLHLDEESQIDAESLKNCFNFVRYEKHEIGQGLIFYNGRFFWKNWLFSVCDAARVSSDMSLFNLQYVLLQRPVAGVHGSFLMLNGEVENEVTWDMSSLTEDYEFSQVAWRKGFTFGAIHGIIREQSPFAIMDFMKQRRRWYLGIDELEGVYGLNKTLISWWTTAIL